MILSKRKQARRGATVVECAIVYPVTFLLILGLCIGGMGIFRYQQVASLAREAARWASVRGGGYAKDTGKPAATAQDIYDNAIAPNAVSFDMSRLSYSVEWRTDNYPKVVITDNGAALANTVTVTVTYQWIPEAFLGGVQLRSTSVMPMSN